LQYPRVVANDFFRAVQGHPGEGWVDVLNRARGIGNHDGFADLPNRGREQVQAGMVKRSPGQVTRPVRQSAIRSREFFSAAHRSTGLTSSPVVMPVPSLS